MRFLKEIEAPVPPALRAASDFILNTELRQQFERDEPNPARIRALLEEAQSTTLTLHKEELGYAIKTRLDHALERLTTRPKISLFGSRCRGR